MKLGQIIAMTAFWFTYPSNKRGSKKEFAVNWGKFITNDTDLNVVWEGLEKHIAHQNWCKSRNIWVASLPHACRFVKNERWWDDIPDRRQPEKAPQKRNVEQIEAQFENDPEYIQGLFDNWKRKWGTGNELN